MNLIYFFLSLDRKRASKSISYCESQSVYVPPAKRGDMQSSDPDSEGHSARGRRSGERGERDLGRERHKRRGRYRAHKDPEYIRNPSKWTKYDLKDDGSEVLRGMSQDQVNKYAAFQFLDEVKKRKSLSSLDTEHSNETDGMVLEGEDASTANEATKVVFKKPSKGVRRTGSDSRVGDSVRRSEEGLESRGLDTHGGGSVKMAEYVVGSKAAAQSHRERRQKRAKLVSLHSEEELKEDEGREDIGHYTADSGSSYPSKTSEKRGKSIRKKTASSTVSLSHLDENDEDT